MQLYNADALASCDGNHRCLNGACPNCIRALQRWLTKRIVDLTAAEPESTVTAINVIPVIPLSETMTGSGLRALMADVRERINATGNIKWAVLALDISYNDFTQVSNNWPKSKPKSGWQPHVYGFVKATDIGAFKKQLSKLFPSSRSIPTPFKTKPYDGSAYGASYVLKHQFNRRVSYLDKKASTLKTDSYQLSAAHSVCLLNALSELGLTGRIELLGLQASKNTHNKIKLISK